MKYIHTLLILIIMTMLAGCLPPPTLSGKRHDIAGTTYGWNAANAVVLSDIKVSNLQIRQVRMSDSRCVSGYNEHIELGADT